MKMMGIVRFGLAASASMMAYVPALHAQDAGNGTEQGWNSGDIIVTARRQEEQLQRVPIAITVIDSATLTSGAITGMKALSKNGFRYPFPQYGVQQDVRAGMAVSYPGRK